MKQLATDADLAETFGITLEKFHELRQRHHWPHVRLGRFQYRFTEEQVAEIVAMQTKAPTAERSVVASVDGQTSRSAGRRRSP